jgi:ATP-dependent RNA helicase DeaD
MTITSGIHQDFEMFDLHPHLLRAVGELDYNTPTPIQTQAIPALLGGRDVLGQAQTGTGKTAAFALPMLQNLDPNERGVQGLVIEPTRELAMQVARAIREYGQHHHVRVLPIYGGQSYDRQIRRLRQGVQIVVGTPGRMLDLIRKRLLDLSAVRYLVLDEADEMLSMGFIEDIEAILQETPAARQTAVFSATLPKPIRRLADSYMRDPETVVVNPEQVTVPETEQRYYVVHESDKTEALARLLEVEAATSSLVFTRTKIGSAKLADALIARGIGAEALHGDMPQNARERVMAHFRDGQIPVLVATDVAARGLDIDDVSHVINYDVPSDPESYVHRIGRTGRAGKRGVALMLITPREERRLKSIESYTQKPIQRAMVPTVEQVQARRDSLFLNKMLEALASLQDPTSDLVTQLCDLGFTPEQIAAAAIRMAQGGEVAAPVGHVDASADFTHSRSRSRSVARRGPRSRRGSKSGSRRAPSDGPRRDREAGMVRLAMEIGSSSGIRPRDVVGAIASEASIPGKAIGAIDIGAERTLVDIAEKHVEKVLGKMQRCRIRGNWTVLSKVD